MRAGYRQALPAFITVRVPMRAPPSDVWSNNALKLALKSWVLCLDPSLQIVPAHLGPVRLIFQILELDSVACVWVSSRVFACAFSNFYRRFKLVEAFISQYCERLKYDMPVHKSSLAIYPQEFLPGHISLHVPVICQPAQSHLPLLPLRSLASLPTHPHAQISLNVLC